jgi:hypothetical protein
VKARTGCAAQNGSERFVGRPTKPYGANLSLAKTRRLLKAEFDGDPVTLARIDVVLLAALPARST